MVGLYKITSPSGSIYIGQSRDIKKRWHRYKDVNSAQRQPTILRSFQKYGIQNHSFEVVHLLPKDVSQDILDGYERLYIGLYKECGCVILNIKDGGLFGSHGESTRKKIGASKKGNKNMLGKKHSDETKKKISLAKKGKSTAWNKGKKWSDEVKAKMYKFPKGHIPYNKGKEHKHHTKESKEKLSIAHQTIWAERKIKGISISLYGEQCPHAKLTDDKAKSIIGILLEDKFSYKEIGKQFGISDNAVMAIKYNLTWRHILPGIRVQLAEMKTSYKFSGRHQKLQLQTG